MFDWIHTRLASNPTSVDRSRNRTQLGVDVLEERTTPTVSAIGSGFNGTSIGADNFLWFSSVAKVTGLGNTPATIHVIDQAITFKAAGVEYSLDVPDSTIVFNPSTPEASLQYNGEWNVSSPNQFSGNVFLGGLAYQATNGFPGGIKNVVWTRNFTSDNPGLTIKWQWAAAVYTEFSTDHSALDVKPSDAPTSLYTNSHHAGTPEAYTEFVIGGARGGGGSNFTGSLSPTKSVVPEVVSPPPPGNGSLSGFVFLDINRNGVMDDNEGLFGVIIHLTWTDGLGAHDVTATTGDDGAYSFTGLSEGVYSLLQEQPMGYEDGDDYLGSLGGTKSNDLFSNIHLGLDEVGVDYNFSEVLST